MTHLSHTSLTSVSPTQVSHLLCPQINDKGEKEKRRSHSHPVEAQSLVPFYLPTDFWSKEGGKTRKHSGGDRARSVGRIWVSRWASGGTCWRRRGSATHCDTVAAQHLHEDVRRWRSGADARFSLLNLSEGIGAKEEMNEKSAPANVPAGPR